MSEDQPKPHQGSNSLEDGVTQNPVTPESVETPDNKSEKEPDTVTKAVGELAGVADKHAEQIDKHAENIERLTKENDELKSSINELRAQVEAMKNHNNKTDSPDKSDEPNPDKSPEDTEDQQVNLEPADQTEHQPGIKERRRRSLEERLVPDQPADRLGAASSEIQRLQTEIENKKASGDDVSVSEEELRGAQEHYDFLKTQDYIDPGGNLRDSDTGQFKADSNRYEKTDLSLEETPEGEQTEPSVETAEPENPDSQPEQGINPELAEGETAETTPEEAQSNSEAQPTPEASLSETPEHLETPTSPEAMEIPGELNPAGQESAGNNPEQKGKIEVPPIDPGDYPDLYARRKNLVGGDKEKLEAESVRLASEMTANVDARVHNFIVDNPDATPEQIRQFSMQCHVESQIKIQEDIINAIDGVGYTDASGEVKGRSRLRRFGAWLDRNSGKIKKTMLVVGVVGAVVLTGGVATGLIVPAFAIGAGTAIGAAKGASIGLAMSRHGSKESAVRKIAVDGERFRQLFAEMDPSDRASYERISTAIMEQFNESADKDHVLNVKKSRKAAIVGAVIGAIAGSVSFASAQAAQTTQTVQVTNSHPPIPHHTIQPGELTGQVINKTLSQMGIDGSKFVNPDGSTNLQAIYSLIPKDQWQSMEAMANGTHSVAGADSLSNEGIRRIIETVVSNHDWGTHTETITTVATQSVPNVAATIAGYVTAAILAVSATRKTSDSVKPPTGGSAAPTGERSVADSLQKNKTYTISVGGARVLARYTGRSGDTFSFTNDSNGQKYTLGADQLTNIVSR